MSASRHELVPHLARLLLALGRSVGNLPDDSLSHAIVDHGTAVAKLVTIDENVAGNMREAVLRLEVLDELLLLALDRYGNQARRVYTVHARIAALELLKKILSARFTSVVHLSNTASDEKPHSHLANQAVISKNKEAILDFIRHTPRARARDIVDGFHELSERTVRRNLRELIESGLVQKRSEQKAVYYFALDLS